MANAARIRVEGGPSNRPACKVVTASTAAACSFAETASKFAEFSFRSRTLTSLTTCLVYDTLPFDPL
jgi:hypothetical protein